MMLLPAEFCVQKRAPFHQDDRPSNLSNFYLKDNKNIIEKIFILKPLSSNLSEFKYIGLYSSLNEISMRFLSSLM